MPGWLRCPGTCTTHRFIATRALRGHADRRDIGGHEPHAGQRNVSRAAVPGVTDPASPLARQLLIRRLLWAVVDATLIGALFFVLFLGFGLVGNRWYHIIGIQSGSMAPTFAPGDLVVVLPPPAEVETGMVLVMDVGNELVTHRVVSVNADGTFATRGMPTASTTPGLAWISRSKASMSQPFRGSATSSRFALPRRLPSWTRPRPR